MCDWVRLSNIVINFSAYPPLHVIELRMWRLSKTPRQLDYLDGRLLQLHVRLSTFENLRNDNPENGPIYAFNKMPNAIKNYLEQFGHNYQSICITDMSYMDRFFFFVLDNTNRQNLIFLKEYRKNKVFTSLKNINE